MEPDRIASTSKANIEAFFQKMKQDANPERLQMAPDLKSATNLNLVCVKS
jgi:hypothetical protein